MNRRGIDPSDPAVFPLRVDLSGDRVLLARIDAAHRDQAAFLDERMLTPGTDAAWMSRRDWLDSAWARGEARIDWIIHIGHCGSTLLSRLMQSWPELAPLREPAPLRTLAAPGVPRDVVAAWLPGLLGAWSRVSPPATRLLGKLTSSANRLAPALLDPGGGNRLVWMDMALEPWLATVFKSPTSVRDVLAARDERAHLLAGDDAALRVALQSLAPAAACAMCWVAERARRDALVARAPGRVHVLDFDALLGTPASALASVAEHLGLDHATLAGALGSPWWQRYSKAGAHAYAAADRDHDLALARDRFRDAIGEALAWHASWLERGALRYPPTS